MMKEENREPQFIKVAQMGHIKFRIGKKVYIPITEEDLQPFIEYCTKYKIDFVGQSSYSTFNQEFIDLPIKSAMNSQVSTIFNTYKN